MQCAHGLREITLKLKLRFLYSTADCAKASHVIYQRIFIICRCIIINLINSCNHIVKFIKSAAI